MSEQNETWHEYRPSSDLDGSPCAICRVRPDEHDNPAPAFPSRTTFGDGRDINEENEEIPEWARPYIRTLKQQVTYLLTTADAEALAAAFQKGIEAVTCIRCTEHVAVPLRNRTANGGECGACIDQGTVLKEATGALEDLAKKLKLPSSRALVLEALSRLKAKEETRG